MLEWSHSERRMEVIFYGRIKARITLIFSKNEASFTLSRADSTLIITIQVIPEIILKWHRRNCLQLLLKKFKFLFKFWWGVCSWETSNGLRFLFVKNCFWNIGKNSWPRTKMSLKIFGENFGLIYLLEFSVEIFRRNFSDFLKLSKFFNVEIISQKFWQFSSNLTEKLCQNFWTIPVPRNILIHP